MSYFALYVSRGNLSGSGLAQEGDLRSERVRRVSQSMTVMEPSSPPRASRRPSLLNARHLTDPNLPSNALSLSAQHGHSIHKHFVQLCETSSPRGQYATLIDLQNKACPTLCTEVFLGIRYRTASMHKENVPDAAIRTGEAFG
jgi:hypothetical protein